MGNRFARTYLSGNNEIVSLEPNSRLRRRCGLEVGGRPNANDSLRVRGEMGPTLTLRSSSFHVRTPSLF